MEHTILQGIESAIIIILYITVGVLIKRVSWWKEECEQLNELIQEIQESNLERQKAPEIKTEFINYLMAEMERLGYAHFKKGGFGIEECYWSDENGFNMKQLIFRSEAPGLKIVLATDYTKLKEQFKMAANVDTEIRNT